MLRIYESLLFFYFIFFFFLICYARQGIQSYLCFQFRNCVSVFANQLDTKMQILPKHTQRILPTTLQPVEKIQLFKDVM